MIDVPLDRWRGSRQMAPPVWKLVIFYFYRSRPFTYIYELYPIFVFNFKYCIKKELEGDYKLLKLNYILF